MPELPGREMAGPNRGNVVQGRRRLQREHRQDRVRDVPAGPSRDRDMRGVPGGPVRGPLGPDGMHGGRIGVRRQHRADGVRPDEAPDQAAHEAADASAEFKADAGPKRETESRADAAAYADAERGPNAGPVGGTNAATESGADAAAYADAERRADANADRRAVTFPLRLTE